MKGSFLPNPSLILSSMLIGLVSAYTFLAGPTNYSKNDIPYSTAVATPHVNWATKLDGGPIKGFFIPSISHGHDMVELMQRLSLEATTVSIDRNWNVNCWGIGDFYGHETRGDIDDFQIVYNYVEKDLTSDARDSPQQRSTPTVFPGRRGLLVVRKNTHGSRRLVSPIRSPWLPLPFSSAVVKLKRPWESSPGLAGE